MLNENTPRGIKGAIKTYKLLYNTSKTAVLLQFPAAIIRAVQPYLALFVTGYILNGFVRGTEFIHLLQFAIGFIVLRFVLDRLEGYISKVQNVHNDIAVEKMYLEKAKKYMEVDFELLDGPTIGEINDRIQRDNSWGGGFYNLNGYLRMTLDGFFGLVAGLAMLIPFFISSGVGGVAILMAVLLGFGILSTLVNMKFFMRKTEKLLNPDPNDKSNNTSFTSHFMFGGIAHLLKTARIYKISPVLEHYLKEDEPRINDFACKFTKYSAGSAFVNALSNGVLLIGAYLFVVARAVAGVIPIGDVVLFAGTIHQLTGKFFEFAQAGAYLIDQTNKVQSMLAFMEMESKQAQGSLPVEKRSDGEYVIEFNNVSFRYPGSEAYALSNFNLTLTVGKKLAIVGMNGSGKTTMIKLLTRLYEPTEGTITLNGIDIMKYDLQEYLSIFSVVFQDFKVFSFTLAENIACETEFNLDDANRAIQRVGLSDRVAKMPNGLQTHLYNNFDNGVEVSGGEAQKIALARALYKNAPFMVLDEPTAALDPIAEFEVYSMFNSVVQDETKTSIFISHRLSSCRFCDDIAVFHEGELIQRGNHDTLIEDTSGKYHEMWNAQAQYYNEQTA